MQLIISVVLSFLGLALINSAPYEVKRSTRHSAETQDSSQESAVQQNNPVIPLLISRHFIKVRNHGFCVRRLSFSLAPGTANGFKGWIKKYNSGYLAADEQLYLFFRCGADNRITRLRRVRRKRSNNPQTAPPPRPCVNDTVPAETEVGESGSGGGNTTDLICPQLFTEEPTESEE